MTEFKCECGSMVLKQNKARHLQSTKHKNYFIELRDTKQKENQKLLLTEAKKQLKLVDKLLDKILRECYDEPFMKQDAESIKQYYINKDTISKLIISDD